MQKNVLLISQYYLPDISAASFRMDDLHQALKDQGFGVSVITTYPQKSAVDDVEKDPNVHRMQLTKVRKKSFIQYLRNYFGFMFKLIFFALFRLRKTKFDYVIVTSPPLFVALGGFITSFFKRTRLILDIRDVWPDSAVSANMLQQDGTLYKLSKQLEKFLYRRADYVTCVSHPMQQHIYAMSHTDNIRVLYNGVSTSSLPALLNSENGAVQKDHVTVVYAGNIGIVQNLHILPDALKHLAQRGYGDTFDVRIIGDGVERPTLEKMVSDRGMTNHVTFTGALNKNEALEAISQADLLFFSLIENETFEKTIPSKLFDYLLGNKPIITSIKGEGRQILHDLGGTIFFDATDPKSLADGLVEYKHNQAKYQQASRNNRQYVIDHFNRYEMFRSFVKEL